MQSVLLASFHDLGNAFGYGAAWVMGLLFVVVWVWVMFKYMDTSDLND